MIFKITVCTEIMSVKVQQAGWSTVVTVCMPWHYKFCILPTQCSDVYWYSRGYLALGDMKGWLFMVITSGDGVRWFIMMVYDDCRLVYGDFVGLWCMATLMRGIERVDSAWWSRMVKAVCCLRQTRLLHDKRKDKIKSNRVVGISGEIRTTNTLRNLPSYDLS
jgi:hypothetical protein